MLIGTTTADKRHVRSARESATNTQPDAGAPQKLQAGCTMLRDQAVSAGLSDITASTEVMPRSGGGSH